MGEGTREMSRRKSQKTSGQHRRLHLADVAVVLPRTNPSIVGYNIIVEISVATVQLRPVMYGQHLVRLPDQNL